jgi:uncharacterized membrane protein
MTKAEFLRTLEAELSQLPANERRRQREFFSEMLDDMMEDGTQEVDAVASLGPVSQVAERILQETPLPLLVRSRMRPAGGWTALTVILLILGAPVWLPLLAALAAVVLSVYVLLWAMIVVAFAVVLAIGAAGTALLLAAFSGALLSAAQILMAAGGALLLTGLGILAFFAAAVARGLLRLTVAFGRSLRSKLIRREAQQ